jgi:hypothetical protein
MRNEVLRTEDERPITNVKTLTQAVGHHDASVRRGKRGYEPSVESPGIEPSNGSRGVSSQTVRDNPFGVKRVRGLPLVIHSRDVERNFPDEWFGSKCWFHSFL